MRTVDHVYEEDDMLNHYSIWVCPCRPFSNYYTNKQGYLKSAFAMVEFVFI